MTGRKFTEEDMKTFKRLFDEHMSLKDIGVALNRSEGSLVQKLRSLDWKRSNHTVRLVGLHGIEILAHGLQPCQIKKALKQKRIEEIAARKKACSKRQQEAIKNLHKDLKAGVDRNKAIKKAYDTGALLAQIGEVVGMTKQGVGLVVTPPKKRRERFYK